MSSDVFTESAYSIRPFSYLASSMLPAEQSTSNTYSFTVLIGPTLTSLKSNHLTLTLPYGNRHCTPFPSRQLPINPQRIPHQWTQGVGLKTWSWWQPSFIQQYPGQQNRHIQTILATRSSWPCEQMATHNFFRWRTICGGPMLGQTDHQWHLCLKAA